MADTGMELEHARQVLMEARRVRQAAAGDVLDGDAALPLFKSLSDLIDVAESLLSQRQEMESRLHRSRVFPPGTSLETAGDRP